MSHPDLARVILTNAAEVARLHKRVHEAFAHRGESKTRREEWEQACAEFHSRYDELSFPGGYTGAVARLLAGDKFTVEATICFLELRPYFFRSGYMRSELLRKVKRAPLSPAQATRLAAVLERQAKWLRAKERKNAA
jgi:hypothetical protein